MSSHAVHTFGTSKSLLLMPHSLPKLLGMKELWRLLLVRCSRAGVANSIKGCWVIPTVCVSLLNCMCVMFMLTYQSVASLYYTGYTHPSEKSVYVDSPYITRRRCYYLSDWFSIPSHIADFSKKKNLKSSIIFLSVPLIKNS